MSMPIDLSDALKSPPPSLHAPPPGGRKKPGGGRTRGTGTRLDDFARPAVWIAVTITALLLVYLGWGLYGGTWADPTWDSIKGAQGHQFRLQQLANMDLVFGLLRLAAVVVLAGLVICCLRAEGVGYALLGIAALLYFGLPLLTQQIYLWESLHESTATQTVLRGMQTVALFYGIPGAIWTVVDLVRHFRAAAEAAAVQRANLKYATAAKARALGGKVPARMSPQQRQYRTYQILAVLILLVEPALVLLNLDAVKGWTVGLLSAVEGVTNRFSLAPTPTGIPALHNDGSDIVLWTVLIALDLVVLSQALRLLEYFCFRNRA